MEEKTGIIVIDLQGDFTELKSGPLAVKGTDSNYVDKVKKVTKKLKEIGYPIFATQDWHPHNHISFYTSHPGKNPFDLILYRGKKQVLWPPHCVQGSDGAKILIEETLFDAIIQKGKAVDLESYSGFKDEGENITSLHPTLKARNITRIITYGIAIDYCVRATCLDGIELGYQVVMVKDLSRGVDPETTRKAIKEMKQAGVEIWNSVDPLLNDASSGSKGN
jgi:nicotinamidase/pyrazinamidase